MRKKFLICIIPIVLIIGIIVIVMSNNKKKYQYEVEKLETINYFLFEENNKYGVIDREGNIIVEPSYDIIEIPNPSKDLFICKSNYDASKKEYSVQVFNKDKQQLLYQYYIVEAIELNNVDDNGFYEKSVLKYKSNGLYGLIDLSGKKVTKAEYESIDGFEFNEGLMLVKKSGKYGIINMNGAVVVKPKYDEIYSDKYYDENNGYKKSGYIVGVKTDNGMRYGYIDSDRKMLLKNEYNDIYRIEEKKDSTYLVAFKDGRAGIYNKKKNIIKHEYEDIEYNAQNDLLMVQKAAKQGVARFDGSIIVPMEYDNILFAGNYINAKKEDFVDIYDKNGNKEQSEQYTSKQDFNDGKYSIISTKDDEFKIIVDSSKVIEDNYSYIQYLFDKYFIVQKNGKFGVIDDNGEEVIACKYEVIQPTLDFNIIQLLSKDGKIEILNKNFDTIVDSSKLTISMYTGYLKVIKNDQEVYIDKNGKVVNYSDVESKNNLYPETIKDYHIVDYGYGCPYYIKQK
ncbi:MAG: WG repeat-containing protein [Clostridia bacterium]|nr:WG repeat-containing protein [Clostridia bacterium]